MNTEYLIVGSGLTGAVIARTLTEAGHSVLILEKRSHIGGNVHDHCHPSGIRIHTYGPHYFRTSSERLWKFVNRFASFYKYEASLKSLVDGKYQNWPIASTYIKQTIGENWKAEFEGTPTNFEEACLAMMPRGIYEKFVKGYTEKQWGTRAELLSCSLAGRFDVREDDEPRLKPHKYQGIPREGYAKWMENMIGDVPVLLNCDYLTHKADFRAQKVIFTGPIDEYYGFKLGKLKYRGQQREHTYIADIDYVLPCGQVNNPSPLFGRHIRTLEWKHMMPPEYRTAIKGTVLTTEATYTPDDPLHYEYPFPDQENAELYKRYRQLAENEQNLLFCGRLGEYRYFDMDQAIARAQVIAERLLAGEISHHDALRESA